MIVEYWESPRGRVTHLWAGGGSRTLCGTSIWRDWVMSSGGRPICQSCRARQLRSYREQS